MSDVADAYTIRVDRGACTRCQGDVAYVPPCKCGHGSIGSCVRCRLVVIEPPPEVPDLIDRGGEAADTAAALEDLRHMLEHAELVVAGRLL